MKKLNGSPAQIAALMLVGLTPANVRIVNTADWRASDSDGNDHRVKNGAMWLDRESGDFGYIIANEIVTKMVGRSQEVMDFVSKSFDEAYRAARWGEMGKG